MRNVELQFLIKIPLNFIRLQTSLDQSIDGRMSITVFATTLEAQSRLFLPTILRCSQLKIKSNKFINELN